MRHLTDPQPPPPRRSQPRKRCASAVALLLGAMALLVGACSTGKHASSNPEALGQRIASAPTSEAAPSGPYAVGRRDVTFVDTSRHTAADPLRDLPEKPSRTLPVMVLYPSTGTAPSDPASAPTTDAPPARGPFPLVEFSHGITASGPLYIGRLQRWTRAGFVVAAPTFPLSGPGAKFPGDPVALGDYRNQPADVRFVLDQLLERNKDSRDPLHGLIDPDEIAVSGHSLGAITTLGLVENSCCQDPRIKAAIAISGIELPFPSGNFDDPPAIPLLLVHGDADKTVPVSGSDHVFDAATPPVYYLRLNGVSHIGVVFGDASHYTDEAVIAFLDQVLKHEQTALAQLTKTFEEEHLPGTWKHRT
jgi:predicted dienelactone hydrolase